MAIIKSITDVNTGITCKYWHTDSFGSVPGDKKTLMISYLAYTNQSIRESPEGVDVNQLGRVFYFRKKDLPALENINISAIDLHVINSIAEFSGGNQVPNADPPEE